MNKKDKIRAVEKIEPLDLGYPLGYFQSPIFSSQPPDKYYKIECKINELVKTINEMRGAK